MNIEKFFEHKIQENIPIMNELEYFQLFITDEIIVFRSNVIYLPSKIKCIKSKCL